MSSTSKTKTISGISSIRNNSTGEEERIVASSLRPDGTVRKERKVRAGYMPEEDAVRFTSSRVQGKKLPEGYVVGIGVVNAPQSNDAPMSKNAKKNARRRKKKEEGGDEDENGEGEIDQITSVKHEVLARPAVQDQKSDAGLDKKIKALKKKLRQVDELMEKPPSELQAEQLQKIERRGEVVKELEELESELAELNI
ncbi:hypothetical protein BJ742DRAFT_192111 [Cladochytrium replicatum]|nr:hypothetical protein BJ742DRAFT_192111 [Cladochytrium replicatum]